MRRIGMPLVGAVSALALIVGCLAGGTANATPPSGLPAHAHRAHAAAQVLAGAPDDALTRALIGHRIGVAGYTYLRALSLWHGDTVRERFPGVAGPGRLDATMVLRDLRIHLPALSPARQRRAASILARPTDGKSDLLGDGYTVAEAAPDCSANLCVHYVTSSADAPSLADGNTNGIPDYVETVDATLEDVWSTEVGAMGYRAPKSDANSPHHGPDSKLDVYIANIGNEGLYGYCTTDDPHTTKPSYRFWDMSAYCVLDDDYAPAQFPPPYANGLAALQVTAAHEFFHAVQFAYDYSEDSWFMEGTAAWMEDEVYDGVNDNRQYLSRSALAKPSVPVDRGNGFYQYGAWIFWRYLTESFDADLVRETWVYADGSAVGIDQYSLKALAHAIADRGETFTDVFATFGIWNVLPEDFYTEGAAYRGSPAAAAFTITRANGGIGWHHRALDHLASAQVRFKPRSHVSSTAQLRVRVNAPPAATEPAATLLVLDTTGATQTFPVTLDATGAGNRVVPFGRGTVARISLILTNASRRTTCWVGSWYSCSGHPTDDNLTFRYETHLLQ